MTSSSSLTTYWDCLEKRTTEGVGIGHREIDSSVRPWDGDASVMRLLERVRKYTSLLAVRLELE